MKQLNEILEQVEVEEQTDSSNKPVAAIHFDSRKVQANTMFVAIAGTQTDGHNYIEGAIEKGATTVICQQLPGSLNSTVTYVKVRDTAKALGQMASAFYGQPSHQLKLIGITGTNGKTTTVTLLYRLFRALGYKTGLLSTVANYIDDQEIKATHTTPDALKINELLAQMVDACCDYCFMEVSSHAIVQQRIAGLEFAGGVFTNITHDHLDYHATFKNYIEAKKTFFDILPAKAFALVNADDKNGKIMVQNTSAAKHSFAVRGMADFNCRILENHFEGMALQLDNEEVWTRFIGHFNASNLLAVYAVARLLGEEKTAVLEQISRLQPVDGRFETIRSHNGITAIVDYAHSPDALLNVLTAIEQIKGEEQQLITVVGAGGDRDKTKRPVMAATAARLSNKVVLTSDNPRSENPASILDDMKKGLNPNDTPRTLVIENRAEAIRTACMLAQSGDVVLVAGKGHETYQEINGVRHHFDDREVVAQCFEQLYPSA